MATENKANDIVIVSAARTAIGGLLGLYAGQSGNQLGAKAIEGALKRSGLNSTDIDQVIMGNVLMAGQGQAPGRQAALKAGFEESVPCTTLNKMCGSGMAAMMAGANQINAGEAAIVLAGGMESMTNAPFLSLRHRGGVKYGHDRLMDSMALDGLEDAYEGLPMGRYADNMAKEQGFTRQMQDDYALETLARAQKAQAEGAFLAEIIDADQDELPGKARPDKIPNLKPAFSADGTVTAANASAISDGAAALIITTRTVADQKSLPILATIFGQASFAQAPSAFTTAPIGAVDRLLAKVGWASKDVDLWEINEAFAVVPMAAMKHFGISAAQVNIFGGACALGHPIGASGARIIVTLLNALARASAKRGVASLCIGGGEATAMAFELNA